MAVDLLQRVGLNKYEAEAYVALLAEGALTGYELGKRSSVPLSKSYETLERLTRRGLALVQPGDPPRYAAERPERFLAQARADREAVLTALAAALAGVQLAKPANDFWVVRGRANVLARARAAIDEAEAEILLALSGGPDAPSGADHALADALERARARGCRVSLPRLDASQASADADSSSQASADAIVLLADGREALLGTLTPQAHCQAVVTGNPAVLLTVRAALDVEAPARRQLTARPPDGAAAPDPQTLDWLAWEERKQRRLRGFGAQHGGRVA